MKIKDYIDKCLTNPEFKQYWDEETNIEHSKSNKSEHLSIVDNALGGDEVGSSPTVLTKP